MSTLFVYPGDQHLFTGSSLIAHNRAAADLVTIHVLEFLARLG